MRKHVMTCLNNNRQAGRVSRPQLVAIAIIVLLGALAGAFVLKSAPSAPAGEAHEVHGHEEAKDHKDDEHHDKPGEHAEGEEDVVKLSAEQMDWS